MTEMEKRMDRFDRVIAEYLRSHRKTVGYLAEKVGCDASTLWRYRARVNYFKKAPLETVSDILRICNVSNEDLRYILGLPTGKSEA